MGYVTWQRPFQGHFVIRRQGLAMFNLHIKFEMSTITCNEEMKGNAKCKKISCLSHPFCTVSKPMVKLRSSLKRLVRLCLEPTIVALPSCWRLVEEFVVHTTQRGRQCIRIDADEYERRHVENSWYVVDYHRHMHVG